jgi:acetyltransferase-like isoleucine patch superfamily enzyme
MLVQKPFVSFGVWLGFTNIDYAYIHGPAERLHLGERCSTMDTLFNVVCGEITVGDDTLFAHGCQVLTGEHRFYEGRRASFQSESPFSEVPDSGNDITIGKRCFIASGAMILKGVSIGNDVRVAANAVVTHDVPDGAFVGGIPARVIPLDGHPVAN